MDFDTVLDWLRQHFQLADLARSPDGSCNLSFGALPVSLVPREGPAGLVLLSHVGNVAREDFVPRLEALLCANLFSDGLGCGAFGLEPDGGIVLTHGFGECRLERTRFIARLEHAVRHALHWQGRLATGNVAALPDGLAPPALHTDPAWQSAETGAWLAALTRGLGADNSANPGGDTAILRLRDDLPTIHVRRLRTMAQVAIGLGEGFIASRDRLLTSLMLSNRFLPERADPWFALGRQAQVVTLCQTLWLENAAVCLPHDDAVQAVRQLADIAQAFRQRLARQGLLAA